MDSYVVVFKAVSEPSRLRIVRILQAAGRDLCICELMDVLELAQYNISKHMKELKNAGLLEERKEGRFVFYSLRKPKDAFLRRVLEAVAAVPAQVFAEDAFRLERRLSLREDGRCVVGKQGERCDERKD